MQARPDNRMPTAQSLATLLQLARRARHAGSASELAFVLVNETFALAPYRQAALFLPGEGIRALSGVSTPDPNAPFVQWMQRLAIDAGKHCQGPRVITAQDVASQYGDNWAEWLPPHLLWLPLGDAKQPCAVLLLAREERWEDADLALLCEWADIATQLWQTKTLPAPGTRLLRSLAAVTDRNAWRQTGTRVAAALKQKPHAAIVELWRIRSLRFALAAGVAMFIPVRMSVLAPGELVPANPAVIRAPFDGTIEQVLVQPNQHVSSGTPLFTLDRTTVNARLAVASQALTTAEAEYRQQAQLAVFDAKSKAQLATLHGTIAQRQADVDYLSEQLARSTVTAPRDGVVLFDDPAELVGRPVTTGERMASVADEHDVEIEAWLSPGDLIPLHDSAPVVLFLNAAPLSPVKAQVRYVLYESMQRPDGNFAYRLRAKLEDATAQQRVGLKGTAKVSGDYVPLVYWILRRPCAIARQFLGI